MRQNIEGKGRGKERAKGLDGRNCAPFFDHASPRFPDADASETWQNLRTRFSTLPIISKSQDLDDFFGFFT